MSLYLAAYVSLFIWYLRKILADICPSTGGQRYFLYLNLPKYNISFRLASSISRKLLESLKQALVEECWNEKMLDITTLPPPFEQVNIESDRLVHFYGKSDASRLRNLVGKYVEIPKL